MPNHFQVRRLCVFGFLFMLLHLPRGTFNSPICATSGFAHEILCPKKNAEGDTYEQTRAIKRINLGCEKPGVRLELVYFGMVEPVQAGEHIRLSHGKVSFLPKHFNDLRGYVRIGDPQNALHYVRFLTSAETWFLWRMDDNGLEITDFSHAPTLPSFGLSLEAHYFRGHSGWMAVVSNEAFRVGRFSRPVVQPTRGGYRVTRWIFSDIGEEGLVRKIREDVGRDGAYRMIVLKAMPPPSLPDTFFFIRRYR